MRRSTVRATRLSGASGNQFDRGAELAPRQRVEYWCADDHHTTATLAADIDPPAEWPCDTCGAPATLDRGTATRLVREAAFHRTPYEFLMMRRTVEDGEKLLEEALDALERARRGGRPGKGV